MTNKMPKLANQLFLGFLLLAFTAIACNNKKEGDKKETTTESTTIKPADQTPPPSPTLDTAAAPTDTVKKKPVKDPNN